MDFIKPFFTGKHWSLQLLFLILFVFVGGVVGSGIGYLCLYAAYNTTSFYDAGDPATAIRLVQAFSSVGMFLIPALLFAYCQDKKCFQWNAAHQKPHYLMVNVVLILSIVILPVITLLGQWNSAIQIPDSMPGLQNWMHDLEEHAKELITILTFQNTTATLLANLLVMALIPAIAEEFLFRGTLQQAIRTWTQKPHVAIWITACVFSFIHFEFSGFIPRLLLGAYLGYLFYWSRSLWLPILAHFLHNALSLIVTHVFLGRGIILDEVKFTSIHGATTLTISCVVVTAMSLVFLWKTQKELYK